MVRPQAWHLGFSRKHCYLSMQDIRSVSCIIDNELAARVPVLRSQIAGPRAAACGGEISAGARRDKSPGDLVSQGIGKAMVYRRSLFVSFLQEGSAMNKLSSILRSVIFASTLAAFVAAPAYAAPKKDFKVAWSIYVGWMPWGYAADTGIVKKWADKYGLNIEVKQFNDYVESVNQYTAGAFDAVTATNMDALSIPAAGGVDTTAVVMGDFSNGNDAVILKNKADLAAIKGQKINLVEFSVSHYLLARALETKHLAEKDIKVVNTSDADMAAAYKTAEVTAVVTWNPIVAEILGSPDAKKVFDSSQIPGEIMDLMVVNTEVLRENPDFGKALVGIWYETIAKMNGADAEGRAAKEAMA